METKTNILNYMADRDTFLYKEFLKYHNSKDEFHRYDYLANVNDYAIYDGMQLKFDLDGEVKQSFVELKGRYIPIDLYNDCAIDLKKIKELQRLYYSSNIPTYLIGIYYEDSKLAIWKIDDEKQYPTKWMWVEGSQIDENKSKKKVWKEMALLEFEDAKICKIPQNITNQAIRDFKKY